MTEAAEILESHGIEQVPAADRHGRARDLFTLWFSTNIAPLPVVTGALSVREGHLPLMWAIAAIMAGHALGGVVLASCSAQGPVLGVPQMMQSRGQFGRYGALLVVGFAAVIYCGFFTSNIILAASSLNAIVPALPIARGALLAGLAAALIGAAGYNVIHWLNRWGTWVMGTALLAGYIAIIAALPPDALSRGRPTAVGFIGTLSMAAIWQISYACYTSDYSRYLPANIGIRGPWLMTYLGALCGTSLSFVFGALIALGAPDDTPVMSAVRHSTGVIGVPLMLLFVLNVISHNALNIYGATLSVVTSIQTFFARWIPSRGVRMLFSALILGACLATAMAAAHDFVTHFMHFILGMLIVLVPWASINLADFYWVKRGRYVVADFFAADGGRYGLLRPTAITAYIVGIAVQWPFLVIPTYMGPIARALDGLDISWLVAPLVTVPVYLWLERRRPPSG